jgi:uncharacterized membrane protein YGL010W
MIASIREWFFEQLGMYAAYHRDRRNRMLHHVGVPIIVFSVILTLTKIRLIEAGAVSVSAGFVILALLMVGYIAAVPTVGLLASVFYAVVYTAAVQVGILPNMAFWLIAGACFSGGWTIQFVGHALEGRRPALTVNFLQILIAPAFLIAEILFALGLERELEANMRARAIKYLPARAVA